MKFNTSIISLLFTVICHSQITYDTSYRECLLITRDTETNYCLVKDIIEMEIHYNKPIPCSTVYKWGGEDTLQEGFYGYSEKGCDTCGPCGGIGMAIGYPSCYEGDSITKYDCTSEAYGTLEDQYFVPNEKNKNKMGERYILKHNEYIGEKWIWNPSPLIFDCG